MKDYDPRSFSITEDYYYNLEVIRDEINTNKLNRTLNTLKTYSSGVISAASLAGLVATTYYGIYENLKSGDVSFAELGGAAVLDIIFGYTLGKLGKVSVISAIKARKNKETLVGLNNRMEEARKYHLKKKQ